MEPDSQPTQLVWDWHVSTDLQDVADFLTTLGALAHSAKVMYVERNRMIIFHLKEKE